MASPGPGAPAGRPRRLGLTQLRSGQASVVVGAVCSELTQELLAQRPDAPLARRREVTFYTDGGEVSFALPFEAKVSELKRQILLQTGRADEQVLDKTFEDLRAAFFLTCHGKALQDDESLETAGIRTGEEIRLQVGHPTRKEWSSCSRVFPIFPSHSLVLCISCPLLFTFPIESSHLRIP